MIAAASLILTVLFPNAAVSRQLAVPVGPLAPIPFAVVGSLIAVRQARNTVGWLLLSVGLAAALMFLAEVYLPIARAIPGAPVSLDVAQTISDLGWVLAFPLMCLILQLFPAGRPLSPRWRILAWATGIWVLFGTTIVVSRVIPRAEAPEAPPVLIAWLLAIIVMSVVAILLRARRARGAERQQIKWLAFGAVPGLLVFPTAANLENPETLVVQDVFLMWIPVTIGIAVLRYRLYEIDRLVSRTIGYVILTATLVVVFALVVVGLLWILGPFTRGDAVPVAASTLVVFALFQPLRRRIQSAIDRRFDRARYDGALTVAAFGTRLRDEVDLDSVLVDLHEVIRATIGPSSASVWLRPTSGGVGR
ncbi:MAG TPA: hypothetical protein VGQ89_04615 [Candidatus Limnocylindrales bacterium]|jgi:hypothetical protein|nr:hypothetical protein [Candidatus Limnocylindrales bacterium]